MNPKTGGSVCGIRLVLGKAIHFGRVSAGIYAAVVVGSDAVVEVDGVQGKAFGKLPSFEGHQYRTVAKQVELAHRARRDNMFSKLHMIVLNQAYDPTRQMYTDLHPVCMNVNVTKKFNCHD